MRFVKLDQPPGELLPPAGQLARQSHPPRIDHCARRDPATVGATHLHFPLILSLSKDLDHALARQDGARWQRLAQLVIQALGSDAVIGRGQGALIARKRDIVTAPPLHHQPFEQPAIGLGHVGPEKRPHVVAAQRLVLLDQDDVEIGLALGQGERDQATGQPAAKDRNIGLAVPHRAPPIDERG